MHFSSNQLLLYQLFLAYPDRSFYMQEIGKILNKKPGVFQRTLNKLEEDTFVSSEFKANARFFQLNHRYPILEEVKSILKKMASGDALSHFEQNIRYLESVKKHPLHPLPQKKKPQVKAKKKSVPSSPVKKAPARLSDFQTEPIMTTLTPPSAHPPQLPMVPMAKKIKHKKPIILNKEQLELF
jgi:hypothetical protein